MKCIKAAVVTHTHTQTHYYNLPARLYSNFNSSFIFIQGTLLGFDLILNKQKKTSLNFTQCSPLI